MNRLLNKLFYCAILSMTMGIANAQNLQVNGVLVSSDNAKDIFKDGKASYDNVTNILSIKGLFIKESTYPLVEVIQGKGDLLIDESKALTIDCSGTNTYVGTKDGIVGVQYQGRVVVNGNGVLKMTTVSSAVECGHFKVMEGVSVELCRNNETNGVTLNTDSITVDNSTLYVHQGNNCSGVSEDAQYFSYKDCYSNAKLLHKSVERRVRERYRYSYNASTHVYEYRTRTVSKWTRYDGWYDNDENKVTNLQVYPKIYPIWVEGIQVDMYNYKDVLGNNLYVYDPVTKTLTEKGNGDIQYKGYLIIDNQQSGKKEYDTGEKGYDNINDEVKMPPFVPEYSDNESYNSMLSFWSLNQDSVPENYSVNDGDFTFPGLIQGKITYDKEASTLTLENVQVSSESGFFVYGHSLKVNLIGTNTFYAKNPDQNIQATYVGKLEFSGSGTLDCSFINVASCDSVIIKDGCTIITNFIYGNGILTIDNSTLQINGDTLFDNYYSGIDLFYELNLVGVDFSTDSVRYRQDYSSYKTYDSEYNLVTKYNSCGHLVDLDNIGYNAMVTISPKYFPSKAPLIKSEGGWNPNAPKYDLWGREVSDSYEGIYIQSGKKFYNKK